MNHEPIGLGHVNLECIENLHTSFAPKAIADASRFLHRLAASPRIHHGASNTLEEHAEHLLRLSKGKTAEGSLRLFHNVDHSIVEQVAELADGLHGATSLCVAYPFFDADGVASLCDSIGLSHAFVHVPPQGSVMEHGGINWPSGKSKQGAHPVALEWLVQDDQRLHDAKLYEIVCKRGRIERELVLGWTHEPATAPLRFTLFNENPAGEEGPFLILRATLRGSQIHGENLEPVPAGR